MQDTILLISPNKQLRGLLKTFFIEQRYQAVAVATKAAVQRFLKKSLPDALILDGVIGSILIGEKIRDAKKSFPDIQVILLQEEKKRIRVPFSDALLVQKPIENEALLTAVRSAIAQKIQTATHLQVADLELDSKTHQVHRGKRVIQLTPQEFKLLHYLMKQRGKVVTRRILLKKIWLYSSDIETRVVDVYIGYLRKKIDISAERKLFYSVRGVGYLIKE